MLGRGPDSGDHSSHVLLDDRQRTSQVKQQIELGRAAQEMRVDLLLGAEGGRSDQVLNSVPLLRVGTRTRSRRQFVPEQSASKKAFCNEQDIQVLATW